MKRVVILGGGFAGAFCARALEKRAKSLELSVHLLNRQNFFLFTPLLIEAGTGSLEPRHAVVPLRDFLKHSQFTSADVTGVDTSEQRVFYRLIGDDSIESLTYDHLVVALGSVTKLPPVPGLERHGFEMKSLPDAVAMRDRAIQLLEQADATPDAEKRKALLHFMVVGGNYSGVEVAGELFVFLREAAKFYPNVDPKECMVSLVEIAPRILMSLDEDLANYAREQMEKRGMRVLLNTTVQEVQHDRVVLSSNETIPTRTVIWCAGIAPNPVIRKLILPCDDGGWIICERDLRVKGFDNIWAIGDCAVNIDAQGNPYPATAQHAIRQGAQLAKNIEYVLQGSNTQPCDIVSQGSLAALGCRTAVAKVFGFKISGFAAWFLWRTVYLMKMPGISRKLRVALDWTIDLFFPRMIVQLGVHRIERQKPEAAEADASSGAQDSTPTSSR